jgi:hypothetical protein
MPERFTGTGERKKGNEGRLTGRLTGIEWR